MVRKWREDKGKGRMTMDDVPAAARVNYDTTRLSNITKVLGLQLYGTIPPVWAGMTVGSGFETGETVCQLLMMGMDDG